jgi:hypothetical protein
MNKRLLELLADAGLTPTDAARAALWVPENVHRACDLLLRVRQGRGVVHRWRFG